MNNSPTASVDFSVFADTGVQTLKWQDPVTPQDGMPQGWQYCFMRAVDGSGGAIAHPYLQWQIRDDEFYLAIDTTLGESEFGHVADQSSLMDRKVIEVQNLVTENGEIIRPLAGLELTIGLMSGKKSGGTKAAHLVIDFGNSRSGAMLSELEGTPRPKLKMVPIKLQNRYKLGVGTQWFSSRTCWCSPPYRQPQELRLKKVTFPKPKARPLPFRVLGIGRREEAAPAVAVQVVQPRLFDDVSMARMGQEVEQISQLISGDALTGVSSPKRYLWSDDDRWLEKRNWQMLTPFDETRVYQSLLSGPLLSYIPFNDSDELVDRFDDQDFDPEIAQTTPSVDPETQMVPQHVPRTMMIAALYEILCQAYTFANSHEHRHVAGGENRVRTIESVTLCHPSGMIVEERERFRKQAKKAIRIFHHTLGKQQKSAPELVLDFDEATAVQLAYVWGELETIGYDPRTWFVVMGRPRSAPPISDGVAEPGDADESQSVLNTEEQTPFGEDEEREPGWESPLDGDVDLSALERMEDESNGGTDSEFSPGAEVQADTAGDAEGSQADEVDGVEALSTDSEWPEVREAAETLRDVRVASIDIGGGTSDLMIASYTYDMKSGVELKGRIIHRDGISVAGDRLMERVLECIIVPSFSRAIGLSPQATRDLFGPETDVNRFLRVERITWMNQLFVPLAHKYFDCAARGDRSTVITHKSGAFERQLVDEDVIKSLSNVLNRKMIPSLTGMYNVDASMDLRYTPKLFEKLTDQIFLPVIKDFCARILEHQVDVVLLAGQPTRIRYLQEMVRSRLPLSDARVIPMHQHYAGIWYPYQDPAEPGVIADPKSAVIVGAAVGYATKHERRTHIRFDMEKNTKRQRFFWGEMLDQRILKPQIWFRPESEDIQTIPVRNVSTIIGRKQFEEEDTESNPVYLLDVESRKGEVIDLLVRFKRQSKKLDASEEELVIEDFRGKIGDRDVRKSDLKLKIWTLRENRRFFLDEGGLYAIDY